MSKNVNEDLEETIKEKEKNIETKKKKKDNISKKIFFKRY